jgi:hypothetical protein
LFGDRTVDVIFINEIGGQVTAFPHGRSYPASRRTLAPSQSTTVGILGSRTTPT